MVSKFIEFSILKSEDDDVVMNSNESEQETDIRSLPQPILSNILARVPAKTVFACKVVNNSWLSLLNNSFFKTQHFSISNTCPLFIFYLANKITVHLIEGESVSDLDRLNSRIDMCQGVKSPRAGINGVFLELNTKATSCEGIICSAPRHGGGKDHVIVFNPLTREYVIVNLFKCTLEHQGHVSVFIGLGFSRVDNKFKLLRISQNALTWWPELCTVGTKGWERSELPLDPKVNFQRNVDDVIYVSGMIYWIYSGDNFICSFDFDANVFRVLPLPRTDGVMHMGVLGGSVCISLICPRDGHVELWTSDRNGGWRKILDIETKGTAMEHVGCLWTRGNYKVIKYLECGKVLLHDWHDTLLVYDPVSKSDKMFRVLGNMSTYSNFQVLPHLPSLVSLRDTLKIEDKKLVMKDVQREREAGLRRSARIGKARERNIRPLK